MNTHREDENRLRESEAILRRLRQETEPQTGGIDRIILNARRHFSAADADPADRMEVLGARIGRAAGLAFFLFLAGSLIVTYLLP